MFKLAYCDIPHTGGTHTVYQKLREGLIAHGIEVRWVGIKPSDFTLDAQFAWELNHGELIPRLDSDKETTTNFVKHIEANYDGIIFNVLAGVLEANAARYISDKLVKLEIVHNITVGTYRFATAIKDYVHATIGVSPRIRDDLVKQKRFNPDKTLSIANAVNLEPFVNQPTLEHSLPLKLIYLGRVEEAAKGVLWLPEIMLEAIRQGVQCTLNIAGDGPELNALKQKTHKLRLDKHISFLGKVEYEKVPALLAQHHSFLMTSRFEGFGLSLAEAMLAGCVPIASQIKGVTDFIITEAKDGYLFPIGNCQEAVRKIKLLEDKEHWTLLSKNAKASTKSRFTIEIQAQQYAHLIYQLKDNPSEIFTPLPLSKFDIPASFKPGLRTYLPSPVKNVLRTIKEKLN
jgi:glycosyltransferase involved in cell wall biosynthesis